MSSESLELETSFYSEDSEINFITAYEIEDEGHSFRISPPLPKTSSDLSDDDNAYADELLADAEWLERFSCLICFFKVFNRFYNWQFSCLNTEHLERSLGDSSSALGMLARGTMPAGSSAPLALAFSFCTFRSGSSLSTIKYSLYLAIAALRA